jgi:hypothetical protein
LFDGARAIDHDRSNRIKTRDECTPRKPIAQNR